MHVPRPETPHLKELMLGGLRFGAKRALRWMAHPDANSCMATSPSGCCPTWRTRPCRRRLSRISPACCSCSAAAASACRCCSSTSSAAATAAVESCSCCAAPVLEACCARSAERRVAFSTTARDTVTASLSPSDNTSTTLCSTVDSSSLTASPSSQTSTARTAAATAASMLALPC